MKLKEVIVYLFKGNIDNVRSLSKVEISVGNIYKHIFLLTVLTFIYKPYKEVAIFFI